MCLSYTDVSLSLSLLPLSLKNKYTLKKISRSGTAQSFFVSYQSILSGISTATLAFFFSISIFMKYFPHFFTFSLCIFLLEVSLLQTAYVGSYFLIHSATLCLLIGALNHMHLRQLLIPWPNGRAGWSIIPYTKRLWVQFLVRAYTQIAGSIPGWGTCEVTN